MNERFALQTSPWPYALADLVGSLRYKPGWTFGLGEINRGQESSGLTLMITIDTIDSYHPDEKITVAHYMPVPPAAYDLRSWRRWLFDQIMLVERHEAMEWFQLVDVAPKGSGGYVHRDGSITAKRTRRPYAPSHGPGNDPYMIREPDGSEEDRRTLFTGELSGKGKEVQ